MRILLATDGSDQSMEAARAIARRPWPSGTSVHVLAVATPPHVYGGSFAGVAADHAEKMERAEWKTAEGAARRAEEALRVDAVTPLELSSEVVWGSPRDAIVKAAVNCEADLVVVGSHGRGLLGRLLLGSVANYVASHVPCSVEIVRKPPAQARADGPVEAPGG